MSSSMSRAHQRVRRSTSSMQAAKLQEDGVSSQTPELEDESSQAKTTKRSIRDKAQTGLVGLLVKMVEVVGLLVKMVEVVGLLLPLVLRHAFPDVGVLRRAMNFWRARMHEWVLDSGTQNHHTSNLELLHRQGGCDFQFLEMDNNDAPSSGDDASAPHVQGRGSVRTDCFDFPGVHYVVGDDTRNVVSVSQLARDHGLVTVFEPTSCHVKEKKTGKIVGKGRLRNGMYILDSLRIVGQTLGRDRAASSGGEHGDGGGGGRGHGGRGNNGEEGEGDSDGMAEEERGGGGRSRDGSRRGGTGASRNQEKRSSGSGASGGDIKDEEIVKNEEEEKVSRENEIQVMDDEKFDEDDNGKTRQEIYGNGEEEEDDDDDDDDKKRGDGSTFGESSGAARKGLFGLSAFGFVLCMCIAACISFLQCTSRRTGVTIWHMDFYGLLGFSFLSILSFQLLIASSLSMDMMQSRSRELIKQIRSMFRGRSTDGEGREGTTTAHHYVQESAQDHSRRLFGLSRFDVATYTAGAYHHTSTNTGRREEFLVDSGAYFHTTWNESILFPYPQRLHTHTKPPTLSLGGIAAGSIAVTRSGYLNGNNIMLDGVLLALEAQANLVSVGQLSIYYGVQVEMDDVGVLIKKKQGGVQIGGGRILGNLYVLEYFLPGGLFAHCPTPQPA